MARRAAYLAGIEGNTADNPTIRKAINRIPSCITQARPTSKDIQAAKIRNPAENRNRTGKQNPASEESNPMMGSHRQPERPMNGNTLEPASSPVRGTFDRGVLPDFLPQLRKSIIGTATRKPRVTHDPNSLYRRNRIARSRANYLRRIGRIRAIVPNWQNCQILP